MKKVALITGVTGQDGSYLAELLLKKGYAVRGIVRRSSTFTTGRIDHLHQGFGGNSSALRLHYGDLGDATGLRRSPRRNRRAAPAAASATSPQRNRRRSPSRASLRDCRG